MSRIKSMLLLMCLIQAGTDSHQRNVILCDILKNRDRGQLPEIHKTHLDSGQQHVAKLLVYEGLFVVWTISVTFDVCDLRSHFNTQHKHLLLCPAPNGRRH